MSARIVFGFILILILQNEEIEENEGNGIFMFQL